MHTIFAYLEGSDHRAVADRVVAEVERFISSRQWRCPDCWVVNQQRTEPDGVAEWDLGLNLALPAPHEEPPSWFEDVIAVVAFAVALRKETGRNVVIGIGDSESNVAEDVITVENDTPDVEYLRKFVGVEAPRSHA